MYEGNYLGSSWKSVLRVISMINYYHNLGSGMNTHGDFHEEPSPTKYDADTEQIKKQNSTRLANEIDESDLDKIFMNSVNLGPVGIIDFISDMCSVSEEELDNKYNSPRIFMLQKLVEVADINMNRVRVEFSNMWKEIGNHLSKYGQNKNKRIAEYTVDSLRQLAKKFLEKPELENFHFQKDFLEPFRTIMLGSYSSEGMEDIRHFILTCMCLFSQQKLRQLKSGWEIIFDIFKLAAGDENKDLFEESLRTMKFILQKENFDVVEEYFNKILDCLFKFIENRRFEEEALPTFELLERMTEELASGKHLKLPVKSKEKYEDYEKDMWKTLLLSLAKRSFDEREIISEKSHQMLFGMLSHYNSTISYNLWEVVFHELLRAIFDDLNVSIENSDHSHENYERHTINAESMVTDFVKIINEMNDDKFKSSVIIFVQIVKNFILSYPESPLGQELLKGLIELAKVSGKRFDQELWKIFIHTLNKLLDETLATSLLEGVKEESKGDSESTNARKSNETISSHLSNLCNTQSIQQLLLISTVETIIEQYDALEYEEIAKLLEKVQNSYDLAHKFNINIERRIEVLKNGSLKPTSKVLPGLIKQERQSLKIFFVIMMKLYKFPKSELSKQDAADRILDYS